MTKKCKFVGFRLETDRDFPRQPVVEECLRMNATSGEFKLQPQHYSVTQIGNYICGRLLTMKEKVPRLLTNTASLETTLDVLPDHLSEASFNYFVLHTSTLYGLYAQYKSSVPLRDFGDRLQMVARRGVKPAREMARVDARRAAGLARSRDLPKSTLNEIDTKHAVTFTTLVRRETMDRVIAEWREVESVKYRLSTTQPAAGQYEVLGPYTHASVHELRLKTDVPTRTYAAKIAEFVGGLRKQFGSALKRTTLSGTNPAGDRRTIDLGKITDTFASYDLKTIHDEAQARVTDLSQSQVIRLMIQEAEARPDYFVRVMP